MLDPISGALYFDDYGYPLFDYEAGCCERGAIAEEPGEVAASVDDGGGGKETVNETREEASVERRPAKKKSEKSAETKKKKKKKRKKRSKQAAKLSEQAPVRGSLCKGTESA